MTSSHLMIFYLIYFLIILLIIELLFKIFSIKPEITRKIAHIVCTLSSIGFIYFFDNQIYVFVICLSFFILLLISKSKNIFKSIDAVSRKTLGSFLLPLGIYLTYIFSYKSVLKVEYILPITILAISDPIAAIFGVFIKKNNRQISIYAISFNKTYFGSIAFLISSFLISYLIFKTFNYPLSYPFITSISFAFILTVVEILSPFGSDNVSVPLTTIFLLNLL